MGKHANRSPLNASVTKTRMRNIRLLKLLVCALLVCAAFFAGFLVRGDAPLLGMLGFPGMVTPDAATTKINTHDSSTLDGRMAEVEQILNKDSLDQYDLEAATENMIEALADTTEDPYLRYYSPAQYETISQDMASNVGGVGVLFSEYQGKTYAVDVFEGSEAQNANVQAGDFVVAIDGDRSHDWTVSEVTSALKAKDGEDVVITWRRSTSLDDEGGTEYRTTLTCTDFTVKNVTAELIGTVGYIKLKQITQNAGNLVEDAIEELDNQGATSFVLDIRDNPGGYLTQAVDVASLFIRSGTIVRIQTKDADETTKNATGTAMSLVTDKPLVVLINENTAASAEVLAAALADNQRATLVGTTTLGKGSVQVTRDLSYGAGLRYTAARYKSPLGHDIEGVGVQPEIGVGLSEDEDNQKALAIETAQTLASE